MRFTASLAALLLLSACATAAPSAPSTPDAASTTPSAPGASSRQMQLLRAAGSANAPTQQEIERLFGAADITRQEGAGAALTYRFPNCALLLLFAADGRNAMRLSEAHPSARHAGGTAPSLDQCATEAAMARR